MIPVEAVEAALSALFPNDASVQGFKRAVQEPIVRTILEAAAPYLLIHVHHHDIEKHAASFNEGYETCMAQELADDPTTAQDWLDEKLRAAKEEAWSHGHHDGAVDQMLHMENGGAKTTPNPYMLHNEGEK